MARKMLRNVEICGVHAAGNGPSSDRKCWQRFERNRSPSPTPAGGPVAKPEITRSGMATHSLAPGNVVSPQRPIIMWHSTPATRNWVRFAYVTCYEMLRFSAFSRMEIRSLTQPRLFAMMNACQGNGGDGHA